jgi:hypothetical protein
MKRGARHQSRSASCLAWPQHRRQLGNAMLEAKTKSAQILAVADELRRTISGVATPQGAAFPSLSPIGLLGPFGGSTWCDPAHTTSRGHPRRVLQSLPARRQRGLGLHLACGLGPAARTDPRSAGHSVNAGDQVHERRRCEPSRRAIRVRAAAARAAAASLGHFFARFFAGFAESVLGRLLCAWRPQAMIERFAARLRPKLGWLLF